MSKEAELQMIGHLGEKSEFLKPLEKTIVDGFGVSPDLLGESVKKVREASGGDANAVLRALERTRATPEETVEALRRAGFWDYTPPPAASPTLGERLDALTFADPEERHLPDKPVIPTGEVTASVGSVTAKSMADGWSTPGGRSAHRMDEWGMDKMAKKGILRWEDMPHFQAAVRAEVERQLARNGMDEPFVKMMVLLCRARTSEDGWDMEAVVEDLVKGFPHKIPDEVVQEVKKRLDVNEFEMDLEDTGGCEKEVAPRVVSTPEDWLKEFDARPLTPEEKKVVEEVGVEPLPDDDDHDVLMSRLEGGE